MALGDGDGENSDDDDGSGDLEMEEIIDLMRTHIRMRVLQRAVIMPHEIQVIAGCMFVALQTVIEQLGGGQTPDEREVIARMQQFNHRAYHLARELSGVSPGWTTKAQALALSLPGYTLDSEPGGSGQLWQDTEIDTEEKALFAALSPRTSDELAQRDAHRLAIMIQSRIICRYLAEPEL